MSRVIAIANQKGGVGKTTTAINLGASLAVAERRTLIIDIDPQANASSGLGLDRGAASPNIYDVLIRNRRIEEATRRETTAQEERRTEEETKDTTRKRTS